MLLLYQNRNASCGKHKEEIFSQLHEMAKKDPNFKGSLGDFEACADIQPRLPAKCDGSPVRENKAEPVTVPLYEVMC